LCPRSNRYLGNGLPPAALLAGNGVALAFGTDSLASCPSLDVLEDARLIARSFPRLPREIVAHALTRGGAQALGFEDLGAIRPGAVARFATVDFAGTTPVDPLAFLLEEQAPARSVAA
jgi:aminodeoxyfutalosine deaminase